MAKSYFVLTNDPDHGRAEDYRRILRKLAKHEIYVTTAVFCTLKDDGSPLTRHCYNGETHTLEDKGYRELIVEARDLGHEIAFHGYSQVSDTRDEFLKESPAKSQNSQITASGDRRMANDFK
jgi:hypothetical protein